MQNIIKYLYHSRCEFYVLISEEANFYVSIWESPYDKILKYHDYFQNININVVFRLIFIFILLKELILILCYIQNTIKNLHRTSFKKKNFAPHSYWYESRYDKILKTHDYFQHININVVFQIRYYFILYAKHG